MSQLMKYCNALTSFRRQLLHPSFVSSQILNRHISYESKVFPDYHVLYKLESVRLISAMNRFKRLVTITTGTIIIGTQAVDMLWLMPSIYADNVTLVGSSLLIMMHLAGYYCNNVIGYLYENEDRKHLMISYVDFWGKRVDVETTIDNVSCIEPTSKLFKPQFLTVDVTSPKLKLKLLSNGTVTDNKRFFEVLRVVL